MYLFLDPLGDIEVPKNISPSKLKSIFSKEIKNLNNYLLKVPESIIETIDEIGIVIWDKNDYQLVLKNLTEIKTLLKKSCLKKSKLKKLYEKIKVLNNGDEVERHINVGILGGNAVIFFDFTLTNDFCFYLLGAKNLYGYRTIIEGKETKFEKIVNTDKYILITLGLYYNFIGIESAKASLTAIRRNSTYDAILLAKKELELGELSKLRFIIVNPEDERASNFINHVQSTLGPLFVVACEKDQFALPRNKEGLLIIYLEKLNLRKRYELLNEIVTGEYSNKLVIVIDSIPGGLDGFPQFREWYIWPDNSRTDQLNSVYFRPIEVANQIKKEADKFQFFIDRAVEEKKMYQHMSAITAQISLSGDQVIIGLVNFWYDLEGFEIEDRDQWLQKYKQEVETYIIGDDLVSKITFKLTHNKQKEVWGIEKNGKIVDEFAYSSSKGMKYISYLEKYYKNRTIMDNDLRKVIDKWHSSSSKTAESSTDAKKILEDLNYLFEKKCPELSPVRECIVISSTEPGCFFRNLDKISIEIFDEDIPNPIY